MLPSSAAATADSGASSPAGEGCQTATAADRGAGATADQEAGRGADQKIGPVRSGPGETQQGAGKDGGRTAAFQGSAAATATADRSTAAASEDKQANRDSDQTSATNQVFTANQISPASQIHTDRPTGLQIDRSGQTAAATNPAGRPACESLWSGQIQPDRSATDRRAAGQRSSQSIAIVSANRSTGQGPNEVAKKRTVRPAGLLIGRPAVVHFSFLTH